MKRVGNLFEKVVDIDNLKLAHKKAKKGKGWYQEVKAIEEDPDSYLFDIQKMLINQTFTTSEYEVFVKVDKNKEREIYKLPYYPDRIIQWALLLVIEPYLIRNMTSDTYSAIPGRGIHLCLNNLKTAISKDKEGCQYCLKLDIKKYYPNINHELLKKKYRKMFKDEKLLWLLDDIIDSVPDGKGVPIGNYVSQYSGNIFLSDFDHWLKEVKGVKHYFRYMDDIVILGSNKIELGQLFKDIKEYLWEELKLTIKDNYQIFPTYTRGIDFVGYRVFEDYVLLRKSIAKTFKRRMRRIHKKVTLGIPLSHNDWCSANSYRGWLYFGNCHRLYKKYLQPIEPQLNDYYLKNLKGDLYEEI